MTSGFDLLAAIDVLDGKVVRLRQGDFDRETRFSDDPVAVALAFTAAGARWLHVVDLDGARDGRPANAGVVRSIVEAVGDRAAVEVAGGLRTAAAVGAVLDAGATRAIVGTAAIRDSAFAKSLVDAHGSERVGAAIDVRGGRAVGHGWASDATGFDVVETIIRLGDAGLTTFEVTAIDRDGMLGGPDLALYERLVALGAGAIVASAGIASLADLAAVRSVGCAGAIVGRALYEGRIGLKDLRFLDAPRPADDRQSAEDAVDSTT